MNSVRTSIWLAGLCLVCTYQAAGQDSFGSAEGPIQRLPATDAVPPDEQFDGRIRLGSRLGHDPLPPTGSDFRAFPRSTWGPPAGLIEDPPLVGPGETIIVEGPPTFSKHKSGFFQKFDLLATWLPADRTQMEQIELETFLTVALPLPTKDHPLLISPAFETRFQEGPITPDVPGTLYSAYVQFMWLPKISERWLGVLGVEPGFYGDFRTNRSDTFRLLGRALLRYDWIPDRLQIAGGVLYLDRDDINVLPAGGIIWMPTPDWELELVYPKPKIARRLWCTWTPHNTHNTAEYWLYGGGEFGGDSWSVQRSNGMLDQLTLFDIRITLGFERRMNGGKSTRMELGYVFSREIRYRSLTNDISLDPTFLLRGGVTY